MSTAIPLFYQRAIAIARSIERERIRFQTLHKLVGLLITGQHWQAAEELALSIGLKSVSERNFQVIQLLQGYEKQRENRFRRG